MQLPDSGKTAREIIEILQGYKQGDVDCSSGKIFAFGFTADDDDANRLLDEAYMMYVNENGLDPTSYPSLVKLETEVVRMVANLLRGGDEAVGNFTTGGTESILLAVKSARDRAAAMRPEIDKPEMVLPISAHCAFHKAAEYFGLRPVITDVDPGTFRADPGAMEQAVNDNTVLLVASAPGYAQGVVDPIEEIGGIAAGRDLCFHVDGCMGGIMLPVLRDAGGFDIPDFDFSVPGVTSISADMHKYGFAHKGASVIVYRNREYRKHQIFAGTRANTYALVNATILSTRAGAAMAGSWAILNYLGRKGYEKIFRELMDATRRLVEGIDAIDGLRVLGRPAMSIFSFAADGLNAFQLLDDMKKKGWFMMPQFSSPGLPPNLHLTVTPRNVPRVDDFLRELGETVEELRGRDDALDIEKVRVQVRDMLDMLGPDAVDQLKAMAGLGEGTGLPEEMALISSVLDSIPRDMARELMIEYFNDIFS